MVKQFVTPLALGALLCGAFLTSAAQAQKVAPSGATTVIVPTPSDAWQTRRNRTLELVQVLSDRQSAKPQRDAATREFDAILTRFDKTPNQFTPMEAMDLYQLFYVPNEAGKVAEQIEMIAWTATLGWYDALRFADESGRAEIVNNEAFFKRAMLVRKDEFVAFLEKEPEKAAAAVASGIHLARLVHARMLMDYDMRWPASYGLLRMKCGLQHGKNCTRPVELPEKDWPAAFEEAAAKVTHYYRLNK